MLRATTLTTIALAAFGCGGSSADERPWPSAYEPAIGSHELAPSLTPDDVASILPPLLTSIASFAPRGVYDLHAALLARGDASCPGATEGQGEEGLELYWENECQAPDGTSFIGNALVQTTDAADGSERGFYVASDGGFTIETPDGSFLRGGSFEVSGYETHAGTVSSYSAYKEGEVYSNAADDAWLSGKLRGTIELEANDEGGARDVYAMGMLGVDGDSRVAAIELRELSIAPGCVAGTVALRALDGGWHVASFGGAEACDLCADLSFEGAALGSFCTQGFDDLLNWETAPW
jgi:hypothetical protein